MLLYHICLEKIEGLVPNISKPIVCSYSEHRGMSCIVSHVHIGRLGSLAYNSFRWRAICLFNAMPKFIRCIYSCSVVRIQNQCARILTKSPRREHITPVLMKLHWLKIQDRIIYKMLMLTYKSYYNMAPPYLCELINKKESHVNTRLGTDHHQLIMPPISKDCSNTFLERSFIYAAPCEWNKLSEHIRTSNFDCFRKSVKTMLFTQQYGC